MTASTREEVLEGLRRMREDVGTEPRRAAEAVRDEGFLDRAIAYLEGEATLFEAAVEVYESIPATYDEAHPSVKRHAAALCALGRVLADRGLG